MPHPLHPLDSYIQGARPRTAEAVAKAIAECPALESMVSEAIADADVISKEEGALPWEACVRAGLVLRLADDWPPKPNAKRARQDQPSEGEAG